MNNHRKITAWLVIFMLLFPVLGNVPVQAYSSSKKVDIMFLHDTHSHLKSFSTIRDDKDVMAGGFAHIKTLIDAQK